MCPGGGLDLLFTPILSRSSVTTFGLLMRTKHSSAHWDSHRETLSHQPSGNAKGRLSDLPFSCGGRNPPATADCLEAAAVRCVLVRAALGCGPGRPGAVLG